MTNPEECSYLAHTTCCNDNDQNKEKASANGSAETQAKAIER